MLSRGLGLLQELRTQLRNVGEQQRATSESLNTTIRRNTDHFNSLDENIRSLKISVGDCNASMICH